MTTALAALGQFRNGYEDHHDPGWVMVVLMVLLILAIAAGVVWLTRTMATSRGPAAPADAARETPMEILDRRLALGEITPEEHRERAAVLTRE